MGTLTLGNIERLQRKFNADGQPVSMDEFGALRVSQPAMMHAYALGAGRRYVGGSQSGATFMAGATAIPTTAAQAQLFNGEVGSNAASYVIDQVSFWQQGGTTVTSGALLFAALTTIPLAARPTASASWQTANASGATRVSQAIWTQNPTAFVGTPVWHLIAATEANVTALLMGTTKFTNGGFLIKPGYALGFAAVGTAGTSPTWGITCSWSELELDLS